MIAFFQDPGAMAHGQSPTELAANDEVSRCGYTAAECFSGPRGAKNEVDDFHRHVVEQVGHLLC